MTFDLHVHSHYSDGTWSPAALVRHTVSMNLKQLALTDHDTTAGVTEAIEAAGKDLEIIPAVEINTIHENGAGEREDIHILGYFIDPANAALIRVLAMQQQARRNHVLETIEKVQQLGIPIQMSAIHRFAGRGSIGRAHITQAIVEAGGAGDVTSAYELFMKRTSPHYVSRRSVTPVEAIQAINAAGGVASIAHPGREARIDELILHLREHGLKSIEAYHRIHSLDRVRHYIRFAHKHGMLVTGGSDCHGPFEDFAPTIGSISMPTEILKNLRNSTC